MYRQSPFSPIGEFVHWLFCEFQIPRSLITEITQQECFRKWFLPGFWSPGKLKSANGKFSWGCKRNKAGLAALPPDGVNSSKTMAYSCFYTCICPMKVLELFILINKQVYFETGMGFDHYQLIFFAASSMYKK